MSRMQLGFFCVYVFWVRLGCVRLIAVIMQLYVTATTGTRNANTVNLFVCVCVGRFGLGALVWGQAHNILFDQIGRGLVERALAATSRDYVQ